MYSVLKKKSVFFSQDPNVQWTDTTVQFLPIVRFSKVQLKFFFFFRNSRSTLAMAEAVSMSLRHSKTIHSLECSRHANIKEGIKHRNSDYLLWDE